MDLISPVVYTPAQHALFRIQNVQREALQQLAEAAKKAFSEVWHNPEASREEMAAALGTNTRAAFEAHAATVAYLLARDPQILAPADYTPPQAFTYNLDGSITLL